MQAAQAGVGLETGAEGGDGATRVIAIRHGETDWNAGQRLQGHVDIPLNSRGHAQAARLFGALRGEALAAVYSSDLGRAVETARAFAEPMGLAVNTDTGLRERSFGSYEGHTYAQIDAQWPEGALRWRRRDLSFAPPGGEALPAFFDRCVSAALRLAGRHPGQTVALVAHGGVLDALYRAATRLDLSAPRTWQLGNASINRLLLADSGLVLVGWNDCQHLEGLDG